LELVGVGWSWSWLELVGVGFKNWGLGAIINTIAYSPMFVFVSYIQYTSSPTAPLSIKAEGFKSNRDEFVVPL
jgi:hypothetical protein